jgi:hypothetical protein
VRRAEAAAWLAAAWDAADSLRGGGGGGGGGGGSGGGADGEGLLPRLGMRHAPCAGLGGGGAGGESDSSAGKAIRAGPDPDHTGRDAAADTGSGAGPAPAGRDDTEREAAAARGLEEGGLEGGEGSDVVVVVTVVYRQVRRL